MYGRTFYSVPEGTESDEGATMTVRTRVALWVELDTLIRWAERQGLHLVEDELVSDAHSHPRRVGHDNAASAIARGHEIIRSTWPQAEDDVVQFGDTVVSVGPDRPALFRYDDPSEDPA